MNALTAEDVAGCAEETQKLAVQKKAPEPMAQELKEVVNPHSGHTPKIR